MGKIIAQRKFAQGVYVPPNTTQILHRKVTELVKEHANIIRRQTTATELLDFVSLRNTHEHKPVVILKRLRNFDSIDSIDTKPDNDSSLLQEIKITKKPISKRNAPKKKQDLLIKTRRNPVRKAATRAYLRWKVASTGDNEFSVDDDEPLTYFTRPNNKNNTRKRNVTKVISKKRKPGPKSIQSRFPSVNNETLPRQSNTIHAEESTRNEGTLATQNYNILITKISTLNEETLATQINNMMNTEESIQNEENLITQGDNMMNTEESILNDEADPLSNIIIESCYHKEPDMDSKSDISIHEEPLRPSWRVSTPTSSLLYNQIPSSLRSSQVTDWMAMPGPSGLQSHTLLDFRHDDDEPQPGPSGMQFCAPTTNYVQPGPSGNQVRKGKAKDKTKSAPQPDYAQPGPSGLQSRFHSQTDIDWAQPGPSGLQAQHYTMIGYPQDGIRAQSPVNSDTSYDEYSQQARSSIIAEEYLSCDMSREDTEFKSDMVQVWLDNGIFKVPKVPTPRPSLNSLEPAMEEENPRSQQQPDDSSMASYPRISPERSTSPMSFTSTLDNTEPEQIIDADASEITVPTRKDRIQMMPLRRPRVRTERAKLAEAPTFRPTAEEFKDPVSYFEKIMPGAAKYGICKVVAPPGFNPQCNLNDAMRFTVFNQYITRMFRRWSSLTREMCTIRSHLATLKIACTQPPLLGGMEVNLPKLYESVNNNGGLKNMNKKAWTKVAEELKCGKLSHPDRRLDQLYVKYLVPYNSLSKRERNEMIQKVEELWQKRYRRMLNRASNPLHSQKMMLGESDSSDDDGEEEDNKRFPHLVKQLKEAEECITKGRPMDLLTFKRIANNVQKRYVPNNATINEIEDSYWASALVADQLVCVHNASIETSSEGYGFTNKPDEPCGEHPWNLKMLIQNNGNILRLLGSVVGLTIPTLHLGMLYSTSCWHRDPHGLPWMEYMHEGPEKIWYGIPDEESERFRRAVEILCPTSCQNKSIWLPSDITMIPPNFLQEHGVSMTKVLQKPGEFVIVFPKAYSCSIATGYTVSESVYFANNHWIHQVHPVFQELRDSCEPSMFSLEHLLISAATDPRASLNVLQLAHASMTTIVGTELAQRAGLQKHGLKPRFERRNNPTGIMWNISEEDECEVCRTQLYLSRVKGMYDRHGAVCVGHALQVLEEQAPNVKRRNRSHYDLIIHITDAELKDIVESAAKRLVDVRSSQSFPRHS